MGSEKFTQRKNNELVLFEELLIIPLTFGHIYLEKQTVYF